MNKQRDEGRTPSAGTMNEQKEEGRPLRWDDRCAWTFASRDQWKLKTHKTLGRLLISYRPLGYRYPTKEKKSIFSTTFQIKKNAVPPIRNRLICEMAISSICKGLFGAASNGSHLFFL